MLSTQTATGGWRPRNAQEAIHYWRKDRDWLERAHGIVMPQVQAYALDEWQRDWHLAEDALPPLVTDPNTGLPQMLVTMIDPEVFEVLWSPTMAAEILGEVKKGDWLMDNAYFPIVEATGEVSSYGDFNDAGGRAGLNTNWPVRQSYLFQIIKEYGERELARAGLGRINWVSELDKAAALSLNKFLNYSYFFGIQSLQCYGLLNDPNLTAPLTPCVKAYSTTNKAWIANGVVSATANEIFQDFESLFYQLVQQSAGRINARSPLIVAMSPGSEVALTATNSFNVNVHDLLKKNFPNYKVITATQYGQTSNINPQGIAAGNLVQMICPEVEGQRTGYCAFNEKMRAHKIIPAMSSFKQKVTSGTFGAILRMTFTIAQMLGV